MKIMKIANCRNSMFVAATCCPVSKMRAAALSSLSLLYLPLHEAFSPTLQPQRLHIASQHRTKLIGAGAAALQARRPTMLSESQNIAAGAGSVAAGAAAPSSTTPLTEPGDFNVPNTVQCNGKTLQIGYRREPKLRERMAVQAAAFALMFLRTRWGHALRHRSWSSNWPTQLLNTFIVLALSRLLFVPAKFLYKEATCAPKLHAPEDVAPLPSSRFVQAGGLKVHYLDEKNSSPNAAASAEETIIHCSHGFGACSLSWAKVLPRLAETLSARVLAHDCPGFGLTERLLFGKRAADTYSLQHR
jgi:hypothetical protein